MISIDNQSIDHKVFFNSFITVVVPVSEKMKKIKIKFPFNLVFVVVVVVDFQLLPSFFNHDHHYYRL